jgi:hypothetical protein
MPERKDESQEGRVEALSRKLGGRFKLTTLLQKQMRDYVQGGGAFMPSVRNTDELVDLILDQVDTGELELVLPGETGPDEQEPETSEDDIFTE